jgi:threonine dehydrogenase-like Zn-dependent dehydrogenase
MPEDFRAVMEYLKKGRCPVDSLISGIFKIEEAEKAMNKWQDQPEKIFRLLVKF